jgi:DNA-binding MarR family transcriptional regulator
MTTTDTSCYCLQLREISRLLCRVYDDYLSVSGVQTGQFGLLRCLHYGLRTPTQLADKLVLDHTTVLRNLNLIQKKNWAVCQVNLNDKRERVWQLTPEGQQAYTQALPQWQAAQAHVAHTLAHHHSAHVPEQLHQIVRSLSVPISP